MHRVLFLLRQRKADHRPTPPTLNGTVTAAPRFPLVDNIVPRRKCEEAYRFPFTGAPQRIQPISTRTLGSLALVHALVRIATTRLLMPRDLSSLPAHNAAG